MTWPQVDAFKRRVREYQAKTGCTQAQLAEHLETTYGTLKFWLSGTRPPKRENLQRASALFGCSITEFMDDPGATVAPLPAGVPEEIWGAAPEDERMEIIKMITSLMSLPVDERVELLEAWKFGYTRAKARLDREASAKPGARSFRGKPKGTVK